LKSLRILSANCSIFLVQTHVERRFGSFFLITKIELDSASVSHRLNLINSVVELVFVLRHHLNGDLRALLCHISDLPPNYDELDFVVFTNIDALIEAFCIKQVPDKAQSNKGHVPLHARFLSVFLLELSCCRFLDLSLLDFNMLIDFPKLRNVFEIRGQFPLTGYNCIIDLWRELILLHLKWLEIVRHRNLLNEWQQSLTKMVACLLGHLSRKMIHTVEQDAILVGLIDLLIKFILN